jgi:hypothetical protein
LVKNLNNLVKAECWTVGAYITLVTVDPRKIWKASSPCTFGHSGERSGNVDKKRKAVTTGKAQNPSWTLPF